MKATSSPMRVPLSPALKKRLERFAKAREMDLSTAASLLLTQQLNELDDDVQSTRAEQWQDEQAWATWERFKAGEIGVVSKEAAMAVFDKKPRRKGR